jgi:hypothetical protein
MATDEKKAMLMTTATIKARPIPRLDDIEDLARPEGLSAIVGPVAHVERAALATSGRSGARHERLGVQLRSGERLRLVLKRNRVADDWEARRTGDTIGREAAVLADPAFAGIWQAFRCPFKAFALTDGAFGLLMDDLTDALAPAGEAPIGEAAEDALLGALASLHARYWQSAVLERPWLLTPEAAIACFRPSAADEEAARGSPDPIFEWVRQGWEIMRDRLPRPIYALLAAPGEPLAAACAGLPQTLLHGNSRVGNFAYFPGGAVAAFDWAEAGAAPPTLEVGWYLAINARRRARTPEAILGRYRDRLETELGTPLSDPLWDRLVSAGLLYGAAMLLWDRALDLDDELPGAAEEWAWWIGQLTSRF